MRVSRGSFGVLSEQAPGARLFFSHLREAFSGSSATSVCPAPAVPRTPNPDLYLPAPSSGASLLLRHGYRHALVGEGLREACEAARERFYQPGLSPFLRIPPVFQGPGPCCLGQVLPASLLHWDFFLSWLPPSPLCFGACLHMSESSLRPDCESLGCSGRRSLLFLNIVQGFLSVPCVKIYTRKCFLISFYCDSR